MLYGVSSNWNSFDYNRWSLDPEGILDYIHESRFGHWSASHMHRITPNERYPQNRKNKNGLKCLELHIIFFFVVVLGAIVATICSLLGHLFTSSLFLGGPNSPMSQLATNFPIYSNIQVSGKETKHTEDHPPRQ